MIDKLCNQHELLRQFVGELLALVSGDTPCDPENLAASRWRLARMLLQHLALEERAVYRPLERDPRPQVVMLAYGFRRELDTSYARYEQHMAEWTRERIEAQWPAYVSAVRHMADFLLERLDREERELFPLVNEAQPFPRTPRDRNWAAQGWTIREQIQQAA